MMYVYSKGLKKLKYSPASVKKLTKGRKKFWVHLVKPNRKELDTLGKTLGLHHLVVEDLHHTNNRAKIEDHGKHIYIVTHSIANGKKLRIKELDLVFSKNWVLTISDSKIDSLENIANEQVKEALQKGTDFLTHKLIDVTVDETTEIVDKINLEVEKLESRILQSTDQEAIPHLLGLRRELLRVRRRLTPLREIMSQITRHSSKLFCDDCLPYYRDVYDHILLIVERIEGQREILSNLMEVHLSMVNNKTNDIMKVLTMMATIMLPITAIGSIYGMNFRNMPELYHPNGYFFTLGAMAFIALGMMYYFKRKGWLQ